MKDIVVVFRDRYVHKGKEYFSSSELRKKLNNFLKREIFIMDEDIFIKIYNYNEKNIEEFIREKIQKDFINNKELLYHYEENKKNNKVYLYALRLGKIENIISSKIKVRPIIFLIKEIIIKNSKCDSFIGIVNINKKSYIIFVEEKNLIKYEITNDIKKIEGILENNTDKKIFIDNNVEIEILKNKINILEKINEKIYKK